MTRLDHRVGRFQSLDLGIRSTTPAKRLEIDDQINWVGRSTRRGEPPRNRY